NAAGPIDEARWRRIEERRMPQIGKQIFRLDRERVEARRFHADASCPAQMRLTLRRDTNGRFSGNDLDIGQRGAACGVEQPSIVGNSYPAAISRKLTLRCFSEET